jgi:hypothetical protein
MTNGHLKVDVQDDGKKVVVKKDVAPGTKADKGAERRETPQQVTVVRDGGGART